VSKLEGQLELFGARLKELLAKAEVAKTETKIDARKHLDELKGMLATARARLDEAKAAGEARWTAFKLGVERSVEELEHAFHELAH
jgi:hypothetical protein